MAENVINGRTGGSAEEQQPIFNRSTAVIAVDLLFSKNNNTGKYKAHTYISPLGNSAQDYVTFNPSAYYGSKNITGLAFNYTNKVYFGTDFLALRFDYLNGAWVFSDTFYPDFNVYDIYFAGLEGYAVGNSGKIRKYTSGMTAEMYSWTPDQNYSENNSGQTTRILYSVWLEDSTRTYAVGQPVSYQIAITKWVDDPYGGYEQLIGYETKYFSAIKKVGSSWQKIGSSSTSPSNRTLYSITGKGNNQFAVGEDGLVMYGNDLKNELNLSSSGFRPDLKSCWLVPKYNDANQYYVWAAGENGYMFLYDSETNNWQDKTEFNLEPPGQNGLKTTINSISLLDSRFGYACGDNGLILKFENNNWYPVGSPATARLNKVRLYAGAKSLKGFIVGESSAGIWIKK